MENTMTQMEKDKFVETKIPNFKLFIEQKFPIIYALPEFQIYIDKPFEELKNYYKTLVRPLHEIGGSEAIIKLITSYLKLDITKIDAADSVKFKLYLDMVYEML